MEGFKVKRCITFNHGIASELSLIENARFQMVLVNSIQLQMQQCRRDLRFLTSIIPSCHVLVSRKYCQMA